MPLFLRCYLSPGDALRAGRTDPGVYNYPLNCPDQPDDIAQIHGEGLVEAADPYLATEPAMRVDGLPLLRLSASALPGDREPASRDAVFDALRERCRRIRDLRRLLALADCPSSQSLAELARAGRDEQELCLGDPPGDLKIRLADADGFPEFSSLLPGSSTIVLLLARWARLFGSRLRTEEGRRIPRVAEIDRSLREGAMPARIQRVLSAARPGEIACGWLPQNLGETWRQLQDLVDRQGTRSEREQLRSGRLSEEDVDELEDRDAFEAISRAAGNLDGGSFPRGSDPRAFRGTEGATWKDDPSSGLQELPGSLRDALVASPQAMRIERCLIAREGEIVHRAVVLAAQGCLGEWRHRWYAWYDYEANQVTDAPVAPRTPGDPRD